MNEINQKAIQLKEIDKHVIKMFIEGTLKGQDIKNFYCAKQELRILLLDKTILQTDDNEASQTIKKVISGELLATERVLKDCGENIEEFDNVDNLGHIPEIDDMLYSWFSNYEYVSGLAKVGSIVVNSCNIPSKLNTLFEEARHAYVFSCHVAVMSLCRSMIEVCSKDLCLKKGIEVAERRLSSNNQHYTEVKPLRDLIDYAAQKPLREKLHWVRRETNKVIHGEKATSEKGSFIMLKETIDCIQRMYLQ